MSDNPTKFYKSMGNVKDEDIDPGEIRLLQAIIRDCEQSIINFRMKEVKIAEKIKKMWEDIKEFKRMAQDSRIFIDEHPLFEAMCIASGLEPEKGRKLFYTKVENKIKKKIDKRKKQHAEKKEETTSKRTRKSRN